MDIPLYRGLGKCARQESEEESNGSSYECDSGVDEDSCWEEGDGGKQKRKKKQQKKTEKVKFRAFSSLCDAMLGFSMHTSR